MNYHHFCSRKKAFCFWESLWDKNCIFFAWAESKALIFWTSGCCYPLEMRWAPGLCLGPLDVAILTQGIWIQSLKS